MVVKNITVSIIIITIIIITIIISTIIMTTSCAPWGRPPRDHRHHHHVPCRHTSIIIMSKPPSKKHHSPNPHHHPHQDNHLNPVFPGGRRPNFGSTGRSTRSVSGSDRFKTMTMIVMKSTTILKMMTFYLLRFLVEEGRAGGEESSVSRCLPLCKCKWHWYRHHLDISMRWIFNATMMMTMSSLKFLFSLDF